MRYSLILHKNIRDTALHTRLTTVPIDQAVMSSVTLAELAYGLHRKGQPARLRNASTQVLLRVDVLLWNEPMARCYGEFCSALEAQGISLSDSDMMIAAHAVAVNATLASPNRAFAQVPARLRLEVW